MAQMATENAETPKSAIANATPLGLCALALTTFVWSAFNAGLFVHGEVIVGLALFYGGLAQLLAGMWEFRSGNTFGALAFTSFGAFWLAIGWASPNHQMLNDGFGYLLTGWAIFTFIGFLATFRTNFALISVFFFFTLTFIALAIGAFTNSSSWIHVGGWMGLISAVLAWYTAAAGLLNSGNSPFTLPTFPRG